jgi:ABC-2 type transport system ATP-binding protein
MIEFASVSRTYGTKVAVDELNLHIPAGQLFALLGHNGAGKTTTIKTLVGLLRPSNGVVSVGGFNVATHTRDAAALIGYVPDQPYLYEKLSGREFLMFVAEMYGLDTRSARAGIDREIARFELTDFVDDLTESYSHGMKQRTVFAAAMLHQPRVLVVDEPLVGLDPHSIRLAKNLLRAEVAAGMCVFMSTHTLNVAEEIADRIGVMNQGKLVFDGTLATLRAQQQSGDLSLEDLYLSLVESHARANANGTATPPTEPATHATPTNTPQS